MEQSSPWWIGMAVAIVGGLVGAIAKLYADNVALRREASRARDEATELLSQMTHESQAIADRLSYAHVRDLRKVIGWAVSVEPPAPSPVQEPAATHTTAATRVRDEPPRPRSPRKHR